MNELLFIVLSGLSGLILGTLFFAGLWWTMRKGLASPRPALWFLGSMLCRTGIALAGFYFVGSGSWKRLLASLLGFIIARFIVVRLTRLHVSPTESPPEDKHANHA